MGKLVFAIIVSCFLQLRDFHRKRSFISKTAVITLAECLRVTGINETN